MMNSLNKKKKIQERIQAPTYAAKVLELCLYSYNDSMEHQHHQQALAKKYDTQSNLQQRISPIFLAKMHKVIFYSGKPHWNHPFLFQEKGGAWSALIPEERIECMHVQEEEVEGQHVKSHKSFPNLLILVICILSDAYKFLSGSVRFLVHQYVNRKVRSQSEYFSEKKVQPVVVELETSPM